MNIIKLHKSITLNVFAFWGWLLYFNTKFKLIGTLSEFSLSSFLIPLSVGIILESITKNFCKNHYNNSEIQNFISNKHISFTLKLLYFITLYSGLVFTLITYNNLFWGLILLSFIPIDHFRKSAIANFYAFLGILWILLLFLLSYLGSSIPKSIHLTWDIILILLPVTLLTTFILIILMDIEEQIKESIFKKFDYGKWFLSLPECAHILYLYIGFGGILYMISIFTFYFLDNL